MLHGLSWHRLALANSGGGGVGGGHEHICNTLNVEDYFLSIISLHIALNGIANDIHGYHLLGFVASAHLRTRPKVPRPVTSRTSS